MSERVYGKNYCRNNSVADIRKIVRQHLRKEYPNYKFSVRKDSYNSFNIRLVGTSGGVALWDKDRIIEGKKDKRFTIHEDFFSEDLRKMLKDIRQFIASHNHDGSDIMTDYFDVKFYSHVTVCYELQEGHAKIEGVA